MHPNLSFFVTLFTCLFGSMPPAIADAPVSPTTDSKTPTTPLQKGKVPARYVRGVFLKATGRDMVLEAEEFDSAIRELSQVTTMPHHLLNSRLKDADTNSDESVDWFEFHSLLEGNKERLDVERGNNEQAGNDSPGSITRQPGGWSFQLPGPIEEFASMYSDDTELQAVALQGDIDGDGILNKEEFLHTWDKIRAIASDRLEAQQERIVTENKAAEERRLDKREGQPRRERPSFETRLARQRAEILDKHDANGNGVLDDTEWKGYVQSARRERRKSFDADGDGKLSPSEESNWARGDKMIVWSFTFDKDRDGVLDREESEEMSRQAAHKLNDPSAIAQTPSLAEELGPIQP